MLLRGVNQERVTQIYRACFADGERDVPLCPYLPELQMGHSGFARWDQQPCYVMMRTDTNAGWGIVFTHVRKQEQHKERTATRRNIHAPSRIVPALRIAGFAGEADIDMPPEIARVSLRGKPHNKQADI